MCPSRNVFENAQIIRRRYGCPESKLLFDKHIGNEAILTRVHDRGHYSMFSSSIEKYCILRQRY